MLKPDKLFILFCLFAANSAQLNSKCVVTEYSELDNAIANCIELIIRNLTVPSGHNIEFTLQDGATVTFEGTTTFEYTLWPDFDRWLMQFQGNNLTVEGAPGHILNGQGELYWDGLGGSGDPKPFFAIIRTNNSVFRNINMLNCPHHCALINGSNSVTLEGWNIDCSYGDDHGGHNTDGFDVANSSNIIIRDSSVVNQDDCVAVNQGFNMHFSGLYCSGTHGISISVGFSKTSYFDNTVKNITYSNCTLVNSINAIHIKTHIDGGEGEITDVTYENIRFLDIINYAINIQEDYGNGGSTGVARGNIPITNLIFRDIQGEMSTTSRNATPVLIFCAQNACGNWTWTDVSVKGGIQPSWCNFEPEGYTC